jgi:hypothetical protein
MVYRSGQQVAQKQLLDHYQAPAELASRSSYLYATAALDRPASERNLEVSEFHLRDA